MIPNRLLPAMLLVLTALGVPGRAVAQTERAEGPTPPRLARVNGEVSFWRPGADDWTPAQVNTPLAAGDRVFVASGADAIVEVASRAGVRVGGDTELGVSSLETGYLQLEVPSGRVALDLQRLPDGQRIEVDTPNGAFMIDRAGYYRVDVEDDTVFTVRRGGEATAVPADGDETLVRDGDQVVVRGTESASIVTNRAPAPDAWDAVDERQIASRPARAQSAQYVPPDVAGADDLDAHGDWQATPEYGQVWVPRDVGPDWTPYTTGRWTYDPYYEWTWVDDAPWGWAPYHYGRWVYWNNYWGWAPGPVIARPVYAPALVGFVGLPGIGVSINIGSPFVGWVPLGWGEPCLPWWGPRGFRGRPYWGGWHGPRYVNNVHVDNRRIVNVRNIDRYRNFDARNGVVAIRRDHFGRGRDTVRLARNDLRNAQPIRGTLGVRPSSASLVARDGRGRRPPERMRNRSVVGTRPPQDTSRRLQRAGLAAPSPQQRGPETRLAGRPRVLPLDRQRDGGRPRDDRTTRQARRGGAPPPPRGDRRERAQAPNDRPMPGIGRAVNRDRRNDRDGNRQAARDLAGRPDVRRGDRRLTAPPILRQQERGANRDAEDRRRQRVDRPNLDRRASRGGDPTPAPRFDRAPQPRIERREAPPPRPERQQRQTQRPERSFQQPRFDRREAAAQRPERRGSYPETPMRSQRQPSFEARRASPPRAQMRPQNGPQSGPQGRPDGGRRGGGGERGGDRRHRDG